MELWRELIDLERTNMTRNGDWLELVKRKAERVEAAKKAKRPVQHSPVAKEPAKPLSKRRARILEMKALKVKRRERAMMRQDRKRLKKAEAERLNHEAIQTLNRITG